MPQPNPVRPGADPQLNLAQAGLAGRPGQGPPWLYMTQTLVRLLRWAFSAQSRIEFPALADRVWTNDEASPIWISSLAEWAPAKANQRPCLLVDRLPQKLDQARAVIGRQFQGVKPGQYMHFMGGAHVVHCTGGRDGEAEFLAAQAFRWLAFYANQIEEALCLIRFRAVEVGKRTQLEDYKEVYTVPLPVEYYYQENWKVYPTDEKEVMGIITGLGGP